MTTLMIDLFSTIGAPEGATLNGPRYAARPIPSHPGYFIGKDRESLACLLISTNDRADRPRPPLRLESLDAQFDVRCHLKETDVPEREGMFSVIRCRESDTDTTRYFLSVCDTLVRVLGDRPTRSMIAKSVNRLADIFQRVRCPQIRSLSGLFGELYLILRSRSAVTTLEAWRTSESDRFDFSWGDVRMDVKAASGRTRVHTFSYEQCNPPSGTVGAVVSLYVEQAAGGSSVDSILGQIEARVFDSVDLVLKLYETVATTLGASLSESLSRRFDVRLAESSLRIFNLEDVPAIRGPLPAGVSDVHFRSDLSALLPVSIRTLIDRNPSFWDLLPTEDAPT